MNRLISLTKQLTEFRSAYLKNSLKLVYVLGAFSKR